MQQWAGTSLFRSCLHSREEVEVEAEVVKVGMCSFAVVEMDTVEAWHPRPFCGLRGSKVAFLARHWHDWALAAPEPLAVEL